MNQIKNFFVIRFQANPVLAAVLLSIDVIGWSFAIYLIVKAVS